MTTRLEYSGQPFGRPNPKFLSKSWRVKHNVFASRSAGGTLLGQDSVGVTAMSPGLAVYCGYEAGTLGYASGGYTTMPQVYSVWPGKKYLSVGRDAIDIEPGLASPGDGPGFVRGAKPPHTSKPVVYCSAGDLGAVIGALQGAGIPRSAYFLWSAHWIGEHICGPSSCGYPQCDGTQYDSNNSFDSDVFSAYMFGPVSDPVFPLSLGAADVTSNGPVHKVQGRLNAWRPVIGHYASLKADGQYGAATKSAVIFAQEYFKQRGVTAGTCDTALYSKLLGAPVAPPPPGPKPDAPLSVTPAKAVTVAYSLQVSRTITGFTGEYQTEIIGPSGLVIHHNSNEPGFTVPVPGPGAYKVTTGAEGYGNTVQEVTVS